MSIITGEIGVAVNRLEIVLSSFLHNWRFGHRTFGSRVGSLSYHGVIGVFWYYIHITAKAEVIRN
jgi:hypothetical protein